MSIKKIFLSISVMTFMVFALSSVTEYSYAYWASNIVSDSISLTDSDVSIGTFIGPWDSSNTYSSGDQVSHNGVFYQAKKASTNVEPGVTVGWKASWIVI